MVRDFSITFDSFVGSIVCKRFLEGDARRGTTIEEIPVLWNARVLFVCSGSGFSSRLSLKLRGPAYFELGTPTSPLRDTIQRQQQVRNELFQVAKES